MRICSGCGVEGNFYRNGRFCATCLRDQARKTYQKNRNKRAEQLLAWRNKNRARFNATSAEAQHKRYWKNPEEFRAFNREQHKKYKDRAKAGRRARIAKDPEPFKAREALKYAVRKGRLVRPAACSRCGETSLRIEAHHADYSKPLQVEWLCSRCHALTRRKYA